MDHDGDDEASSISLQQQQYQTSRKRETKKSGHGYTMFVSDNSDDDDDFAGGAEGNNKNGLICTDATVANKNPREDVKSPNSKLKKHGKPSFKFTSRKDKIKSDAKMNKEKNKTEKQEAKEVRRKHLLQLKKDRSHKDSPKVIGKVLPVFGVPLSIAVSRSPSNDGVLLPALFRDCIDFIEEQGLECEGIYRVSGVKSKVHSLKDLYDNGKGSVNDIRRHEPNVIASFLKLFIRELSEPILTEELQTRFEAASSIKNPTNRIQQIQILIDELPGSNRLLLSWIILHMSHVIDKRHVNKMTLQNVSIVLSPTLRISHRLLYVLFTQFTVLFCGITIKPHPPSSQEGVARRQTVATVQEELTAGELSLSRLHELISTGDKQTVEAEDELWEIQRRVTELKRSLKALKRSEAIMSASTSGTQSRRSSTQPNIILKPRDDSESLPLAKKKNKSGDGPESIKRQTTPTKDVVDGACLGVHRAGHAPAQGVVAKDGSVAKEGGMAKDWEIREKSKSLGNNQKLEHGMDIKDVSEGSEVKIGVARLTKSHSTKHRSSTRENIKSTSENVKDNTNPGESDVLQKTHKNIEVKSATGQDFAVPPDTMQESTQLPHVTSKPIIIDGEKVKKGKLPQSMAVDRGEENHGENMMENYAVPDINRRSPVSMTDRPPSLILKPRAHTLAHPVARSPCVTSPLTPLSCTMLPQPSFAAHTFAKPSVVGPPRIACSQSVPGDTTVVSAQDDAFTAQQAEERELMLKLTTLRFVEEELLAMGNELKQKKTAENDEMERLKMEIGDIRDVRSRFYNASDSEDEFGYSSSESEIDEPTQIEVLRKLNEDERNLIVMRDSLRAKIFDERQQCLNVKVEIRFLQNNQQRQ